MIPVPSTWRTVGLPPMGYSGAGWAAFPVSGSRGARLHPQSILGPVVHVSAVWLTPQIRRPGLSTRPPVPFLQFALPQDAHSAWA